MIAPAAPLAFHYRRAVAPMMWVLVGIGSIELVVVHLVISFWYPTAALVLSLGSAAALLWVVAPISAFGRLPVLLDRETLVMRVGWLKCIVVPVAAIADAGGERSRAELSALRASNFALVAHPNVVVTLKTPLRFRGREIGAVAHRLDDASAFLRALEAIRATP